MKKYIEVVEFNNKRHYKGDYINVMSDTNLQFCENCTINRLIFFSESKKSLDFKSNKVIMLDVTLSSSEGDLPEIPEKTAILFSKGNRLNLKYLPNFLVFQPSKLSSLKEVIGVIDSYPNLIGLDCTSFPRRKLRVWRERLNIQGVTLIGGKK